MLPFLIMYTLCPVQIGEYGNFVIHCALRDLRPPGIHVCYCMLVHTYVRTCMCVCVCMYMYVCTVEPLKYTGHHPVSTNQRLQVHVHI